jgi:CshA-type fibril repeat protein
MNRGRFRNEQVCLYGWHVDVGYISALVKGNWLSLFTRIKHLSGKSLVGLLAATALIGTSGMVTAQAAQAETATSSSQSEQQSNAVQGCSYGSGGPNADALCWIDFSTFGTVSADSMPANKPLTINLGRYKITMNVKVSAGADGANGVLATQLPTWTESGKSGSLLGATKAGQDYYVGTSGKPALYQVVANPGITTDFAQRDTVSLEQIQVFDTQNNDAPVTSGYSLVMADAESTGPSHEGFTWTSDKALNKYLDVTPSGWAEPCTKGLTGLGSTSVTCETANGTVPGNGIVMVSADAPTTISSAFRNSAGGNSRQGIAIAVVFSTATAGLNVVQNGGSNAGFTVTAKNEGGTLGATSSSGGETSSGKQQFLSGAEGSKTTYSIAKSTGSNTTSEDAYKIIWECQVNGEKYTPVLSADGKTATVTTPANGASSCVATATAEPPTTGDDSKTINPNTTAELSPETTKGAGDIKTVTFADGSTTKTVPGEGTWTIELVNGQPKAKFTPEAGYAGKVTEQAYTVTDVNGLTATGKLDVTINVPPTTGDDSKTVAQGESATLMPKSTRGTGALTQVAFDNGQQSKTVPGEGVWTIELVNGQPKAKFTPEAGYAGKVTEQPYTVTDVNGLTATGKLDVTIKPTTGDDSKTINPNTTATLTPKTIPGSGDITSAAFADGSTTKTVPGEGTWTIELVNGQPKATFTPDKDYTGKVTEQSYTVTDVNGLTATGKLDVTINVPPTTGDASKTINPNETATLTPKTTPGTGAIKTVTFADGSTTKTVPGEGTWTIELVNGQPKATFTPDKDYTGKVTEQSYTVTDVNGLTATGKLDVTINVPPTTGDASKTINPNETATLTPKTTPGTGAIKTVTFADGSTTKTVPGEGTWTIELVNGQPKATFTPDKDYSGKVTPQSYTVTDVNGLTATGKLEVTIKVPAVTVVPSTPSTSSSSDGAVSVPAGKSLAHTGAAVASVLVVAGLLAVLGFAILRIRKNSKN